MSISTIGAVTMVDLRSTGGADVAYANDRPPHDSTFITRLREAGAINSRAKRQGRGFLSRAVRLGV